MTTLPKKIRYKWCDKRCRILNEFRKYGKYCDLELKVCDNVYTCHRSVLAASSVYFNVMFSSDFEEKNASSISLSGEVNASVFDMVLEFLYTGNIMFTAENANAILRTSHYLQIKELENECARYIINNPRVQYVLEIADYFISIGRNNDEIITTVHYIIRNMKNLRKTRKFLNISYVLLHKIIKNIRMVTDNNTLEVEYVEAIFEWVKFKWNDRQYVLEELLGHVTTVGTYQTVVQNLFKLTVGKDKTRVDQYPHIICTSLKDDIYYTCELTICSEGEENKFSHHYICNQKKYIRTTRFKNYNYYLSWNDECITNTFMKNFDENILASPPIFTKNYSLTTLGETMYLYDSSKKYIPLKYTISDEDNAMYAYNYYKNEWFSTPKIPKRLFNSYLVSMNGMLYLIGGSTKFRSNKILEVVQCLDKRSSKWITKPMNQDLLLNGAVCVHRNEIYIYEKHDIKTNKGRFHIYNPVADRFRSVDVDKAYPLPGVLISSPYQDKLWYYYQSDGNLHRKIYRPLREEWDEDFSAEPFSTLSFTIDESQDFLVHITDLFDGLFY